MSETVKMDLFNVVVKLGDRENDMLVHSAPREKVTATEIRLLKGIHGQHCIVGTPVKVGTVERSEREELHRLCMIYKPRVVAGILKEDVSGYENYADRVRTEREAELEENQRKRQENDLRAKAEAQAGSIAAVLNQTSGAAGGNSQKQQRQGALA